MRFSAARNNYSAPASIFLGWLVGIPEEGYNPLIDSLLNGAEVLTGIDYLQESAEINRLCSNILYTGCIDEFFKHSLGRLGYRSLRFDVKIEPKSKSQGCPVMNFTGMDVPYTRCIEHNQFTPDKKYEEIVKSYEYPQDYAGGAEPYYPIINAENRILYSSYAKLAESFPNLHFGGRLGMFQYMDMDDAIEAALRLANKLKNK